MESSHDTPSISHLDSSRLKCSFHGITVLKPSHSGDLHPVKLEIEDNCLTSQTDELAIISDKIKSVSSRSRPLKSGMYNNSITELKKPKSRKAIRSADTSYISKNVSFVSTSEDFNEPSTSTLPAVISPSPSLPTTHPSTPSTVYTRYMPTTGPTSLTPKQRTAVLHFNLRHLIPKADTSYTTPSLPHALSLPASATVPPFKPSSALQLSEPETVSQQDILHVQPAGLQLQYPEDEPQVKEICTGNPPAVVTEASSFEEERHSGDDEMGMEVDMPEGPEPGGTAMDMVSTDVEMAEAEEDTHQNTLETSMETATAAGQLLSDSADMAVHEAEATEPPSQLAQAEAPADVVASPPSIAKPIDTEPPRVPQKEKVKAPSSLFIPKKPHRPISKASSVKNARPRTRSPSHELSRKPKNWACTPRREILGPRAPQTAFRPPLLSAAKRGRQRTLHMENYRIQDDHNAKHPQQQPAPSGLVDKMANTLVAALTSLRSVLLLSEEDIAARSGEVQKALRHASSALDDFWGNKRFISLDFLRSRQDLLTAVGSFAGFEESESWPSRARELKRKAEELDSVWRERFQLGP